MTAVADPALKRKTRKIYETLHQLHPDAICELNYTNSLQLMVATILSAQCTDVRVNIVTKELFRRCKTVTDYDQISQTDLEEIVRSTGFFRQKAKSIKGAARRILELHKGRVPKTIEELVELPGVGRKTANVILGNSFGIPGLPVDTHVGRIVRRLGLTDAEDPVKVEYAICALLPPEDWTMFSHVVIFHGRRVCKARKPRCSECPVTKVCQYFQDERDAHA